MSARYLQTMPTTAPSEAEALLAEETSRRLAPLLGKDSAYQLQFLTNGEPGEVLAMPATALHLLVQILAEMAQGNAVTLTPIHAELSTQQAADLLNVSHLFLVQLLEKGAIPFHKVGTRCRIRLQDMVAYKQRQYAARSAALNELAAYDQELGLE